MTEALRNEGKIWQGLLLCGGINYVLAFTGCTVAWAEAEGPGGSDALINAAFWTAFSIGLLQLLYVIPVCRALKKNGKTRTLKGVMIRRLDYGSPECCMVCDQGRAKYPITIMG